VLLLPCSFIDEQPARIRYVDVVLPRNAELVLRSNQTVVALKNFILAMTIYTDVQQRAQAEIDRVLGGGRLPTFEDQDQLPYTVACLKELLRWQQVDTLAVPHRLTQDDVYRGYLLPAGTTVIGNAWLCHFPPLTIRRF
jgi:cytochrome P450